MKKLKAQTVIEYNFLIVAVLVLILIVSVTVYMFFNSTTQNIKTTEIPVVNFKIIAFSANAISGNCSFNFTFDMQKNTSLLPIKLRFITAQQTSFLAPINNSTYTAYSYSQIGNMYHYKYMTTLHPFNSTVCSLFTQVPESSTGTIDSILVTNNTKEFLYKLSTPAETLIP